MLLLLLTKMPKSIQQKKSAETLMEQGIGSTQVYSYSPDNFYQKRGVWSLQLLRLCHFRLRFRQMRLQTLR